MENLFGHELVETNTTSFGKTFDIGFLEIAFSSFNIEIDIFLRILKISKMRNIRINVLDVCSYQYYINTLYYDYLQSKLLRFFRV